MREEKTEFMCVRPALAARLLRDGYEAEQGINPWDNTRTAWVFQLDHSGVQKVARYYCQIGKRIPHQITQAITEAAEVAE